jgi:hypothetical protein
MPVEKTFVDLRLNLCNGKEVLKSLPDLKSFLEKPKSDRFLEKSKSEKPKSDRFLIKPKSDHFLEKPKRHCAC